MLVVGNIREQFPDYVLGLEKRGISGADSLLKSIILLDDERKSVQQLLDNSLNQANLLAKEIGALMKSGNLEQATAAKLKTSNLKEESKRLSDQLVELEQRLKNTLYTIPNVPNKLVPIGKSAEDNEVVKTGGQIPELYAGAKPHWDLIAQYDIVDFELGIKVTGAGFPFYKREGARLVRAMVNYFLDSATAAGYQEIQPPTLINEESGYGTGNLPDKEGQMYQTTDGQLYLIPTAEVPITNMYRNVILAEEELPVKLTGYTPCFRREAGSWGAHVRGLNRLHQFDKVEIVQIAHPDKSPQVLDEMIAHVEGLIKSLELPYRILRLCGGDMGFTSSITYDFEVYSAAQKKWLEVSSVSNFETYQSNRLMLRYKDKTGKKNLAHTLNGSALAVPRILASLLENNQTATGIHIPAVLHPYTGFKSISR